MMIWGLLTLSGLVTFGYCSIYDQGWDAGQREMKAGIEAAVDAHDAAAEAVYRDELEDGAETVEAVESSSDEGEILEGVMELYDR